MKNDTSSDLARYIAAPEEIIAACQAGHMVVLADDEDRENEGDLVIPAQFATADIINFMAKHARGLICLAMEPKRIERLGLPMMSQLNGTRHQTAFTVSIEAREGVTTGISAADRARTIHVAIADDASPQHIVTPGHVFPLMAREGGVLARAGHTEAAVDIARLGGLTPAGVICEIMNEDGSMARLPDLVAFAQKHNLKLGTVADLMAYRRRTETIVERKLTRPLHSSHGGAFTLHLYVNTVAYAEHVALVMGDLDPSLGPPLVRMHALNVLEDVLGDQSRGHDGTLQAAMRMIAKEKRGVIVLIREPNTFSLSRRLSEPASQETARQPLRDYGVGAQILQDLGVRDMVLLTNAAKSIVGLDAYGLKVVAQKQIEG